MAVHVQAGDIRTLVKHFDEFMRRNHGRGALKLWPTLTVALREWVGIDVLRLTKGKFDVYLIAVIYIIMLLKAHNPINNPAPPHRNLLIDINLERPDGQLPDVLSRDWWNSVRLMWRGTY